MKLRGGNLARINVDEKLTEKQIQQLIWQGKDEVFPKIDENNKKYWFREFDFGGLRPDFLTIENRLISIIEIKLTVTGSSIVQILKYKSALTGWLCQKRFLHDVEVILAGFTFHESVFAAIPFALQNEISLQKLNFDYGKISAEPIIYDDFEFNSKDLSDLEGLIHGAH